MVGFRPGVIFLTLALPLGAQDSASVLREALPDAIARGRWEDVAACVERTTPDAVDASLAAMPVAVRPPAPEGGSVVAGPLGPGESFVEPSLEVDPRGILHLVYGTGRSGTCRTARHARWRDGAWTPPQTIVEAPRGRAIDRLLTAMDAAGRIHLMVSSGPVPALPDRLHHVHYLQGGPDGRWRAVGDRALPVRARPGIDGLREPGGTWHLVWQGPYGDSGWPHVTHVTWRSDEGWNDTEGPTAMESPRLMTSGGQVRVLGSWYGNQIAAWNGAWTSSAPLGNGVAPDLVMVCPIDPVLVDFRTDTLLDGDTLPLFGLDAGGKLRPDGRLEVGPVAWRDARERIAFRRDGDGRPVGIVSTGSVLFRVLVDGTRTRAWPVAGAAAGAEWRTIRLQLDGDRTHVVWVERSAGRESLRHAVWRSGAAGGDPLGESRVRALAGRGFSGLDRDLLACAFHEAAEGAREAGDTDARIDACIQLVACSGRDHVVPRALSSFQELDRWLAKDPARLESRLRRFLDREVLARGEAAAREAWSRAREEDRSPRLGQLLARLDLEPGEEPAADRPAVLDDVREAAFRHVMEVAPELSPPRPLGLAPHRSPFGEGFFDRFGDLDAPVGLEEAGHPELRRLAESGRRFLAGGRAKMQVALFVGMREAGRFWITLAEEAGAWKVRASRRLE